MQDDSAQPLESSQLVGAPDPGSAAVPPLKDKLSIGLIGIGSALLMVFVFRMLWRGSKARRAPAAREQSDRPKPTPSGLHPAHDRLERTMADAEELTRRLAAILDNKAARLETLIAQVDERLARLGEAQDSAPRTPSPLRERAPEAPRPLPSAEGGDLFHRKVYELADQGLSPIDIARRIDKPTGQVELILALRRA